MTFELDTGGRVRKGVIRNGAFHFRPGFVRWSDLTHFAQGYTGAALSGPIVSMARDGRSLSPTAKRGLGFSDLAPETVQQIVEDCAVFNGGGDKDTAVNGAACWRIRQDQHPFAVDVWRSRFADFLPQTVYLADDGKIYLKEAN